MSLNINLVRSRLPEREIVYFSSTDTTMREAAALAAQGCPSGTTVVADTQTAGLGRHGRTWYSEPGTGLYVSIVLRPAMPPDELPVLTLALGLATAEAIARAAGLACDLRWPNDVLIRDQKVAGILVQVADDAVIAGIGVNVNHRWFPGDLQADATSLALASGGTHSREELLVRLVESVDSFTRLLVEAGRRSILDLFAGQSTYASGRRVTVYQGGTTITGVTCGLDSSGFLMVRKDDGTVETILAGGVRAAGAGRR